MQKEWVTLESTTLTERDEQLKLMMDLLIPDIEHIEMLLDVYSEMVDKEEKSGNKEATGSLAMVLSCLVFSYNVLNGIKHGDLVLMRKET